VKTIRTQLLILLVAVLWSSTGAAKTGNLPTQQFQPPAGGDENFVGLMGHDVLNHLQSSFGMYLNYAYKPLAFTLKPWDVTTSLVRNQFAGDFLAAVGFFGQLELGLAVPMTFFQNSDGDALRLSSTNIARATIGDIRLTPKWRFYHRESQGGLALAAVVSLPSGGKSSMQGNETVTVEPRLIFDWLFHPKFRLGLNAGYLLREQQGLFNVDVGNEFSYGAAVEWLAVKDRLSVIAEVLGKVAADADSHLAVETMPLESMLGLRYHSPAGHSITVAGGPGLTNGYGTPTYRLALGYTYTGPIDTDGDGCYDNVDPCPLDPEDKDGFEDGDCCPDVDNDRDGICDPWVMEKGLTSKYAAVCHGSDLCPNIPEDKDGFEDEDGCPDADNDRDGICDPWVSTLGQAEKYAAVCHGSDQCPDVPEDKDGFEDEDGCPDADNDHDGICDPWVTAMGQTEKYADKCRLKDLCPDVPETVNGFEDDDGCPDAVAKPALARIEGKKIIILDVILFYFDKTVIKPESYPVIDAVVQVLKDNPQIKKIRIEGHTDLKGGVVYNKNLSNGRSKAVQTYLWQKGIGPERLSYAGFGKSRPLVKPEKTPEDAQKNRRVEFIIVKTAEAAK